MKNLKAFCIGVEHLPESMSQVEICLESAKKYNYNCEWFKAFTGETAQIYFEKNNVKFPTKCPPGITEWQFNHTVTKWLPRRGLQGCMASQQFLWRKCIELDEPIIIMEHDGIFIREWDDSIDWVDVLHLDPIGGRHKDAWKVLHNKSEGIHDFIYGHDMRTGHRMAGCHSYAIKPHAAQKLIDYGSEHGFMNNDAHINWNKVSIQGIKPGLAAMQETGRTISLTESII